MKNMVTSRGYYGDSHSLEQRRRWYDPVAEAYDRARPRYPAELLDQAIAWANLAPGARLLEIGCGPGIATVDLAQREVELVALEPSRKAWQLARRHCAAYGNVSLINQTFEDWPLEVAAFDAIVAATSFHWVSPEMGHAKVAEALKPGGALILLWNVPPQPRWEIAQGLIPLYQRHGPGLEVYCDRAQQEGQLRAIAQQQLHRGEFVSLGYRRLDLTRVYSVPDYLSLLSSLSPYIALDPKQRKALFVVLEQRLRQDVGDRLETRYFSALQVLQKRSFPEALSSPEDMKI